MRASVRFGCSAVALLSALLGTGGCQSEKPAVPTESHPSVTSRYDGTYRRTTDWSRVEPCPDDDVPPTDVGVNEIAFDDGSLQMWGWPKGHEDERELNWEGSYSFFQNQVRIEDSLDSLTFDVGYDGTSLTLNNLRGGTCGDARAWTTGTWVRQ